MMRKSSFIVIVIVIILTATTAHANIEGLITTVHPEIPEKRLNNLVNYTKLITKEYDVPEDVIWAIMWNETDFRNVRSNIDKNPASCGYMQVLETTAEGLLNKDIKCDYLIYNWRTGINLGVRYFSIQFNKYDNITIAIGRYNGINNQGYIDAVLEKLKTVEDYIEDGQ